MSSEMLSASKYLCIINERGKRKLPLKRVYRNLRQRGLLLKAYENLYDNRGATTAGSDPNDTIQGMSVAKIDVIVQQLHDGVYRWKPARRIYVPKANGQKRPIAIPCWSDKLVQEAIRLILEAYYEPQFRDCSHGFRPQRSCHTALKQVKTQWTGTKWFIEGDLKGCYDNISKSKLLALLAQRIQDNRFLKLLREMLDAGYIENWAFHPTHSGVPQGSGVSPVLSNIMLHEFDCWVQDILIPQHTRGDKRKYNLVYKALIARRSHAKKKQNWVLYTELGKQLRRIPSKATHDPDYRRLRFQRYADDFLFGYVGSKAEALIIKQQVADFLAGFDLELSQEKTLITHARNDKAHFLGYTLHVAYCDSKLSRSKQGCKTRAVNGSIQLGVPHAVTTKWLRKFCVNGNPQRNKWLRHYSDYEIVNTFGTQLRGLVNYYQLAPNISTKLEKVRWVCVESCRKTLAARHKLSRPKSYRRYVTRPVTGERVHIRVVVDRPKKQPLIAKCGEQSLRYNPSMTYAQDTIPPFTIVGRQRELTKRLLAEQCECCETVGVPLEAHHINKLSTLRQQWRGRKQKPDWVAWMLARRRKTIFVCRECHRNITYGRYDGAKLV